MNKSVLFRVILFSALALLVLGAIAIPHTINADLKNIKTNLAPVTLVHNGHLTISKLDKSSYEVVKTFHMIVTAYSSTPDQTDDTPFITASGKHVEDGIIANNLLPFGTKVRIMDKIYTVEDRMHQRMGKYRADIWFPTRQEAVNFGAKFNVKVEVLES